MQRSCAATGPPQLRRENGGAGPLAQQFPTPPGSTGGQAEWGGGHCPGSPKSSAGWMRDRALSAGLNRSEQHRPSAPGSVGAWQPNAIQSDEGATQHNGGGQTFRDGGFLAKNTNQFFTETQLKVNCPLIFQTSHIILKLHRPALETAYLLQLL